MNKVPAVDVLGPPAQALKGDIMDISIIVTIAFTAIPTAAIVVLYLMMSGKHNK